MSTILEEWKREAELKINSAYIGTRWNKHYELYMKIATLIELIEKKDTALTKYSKLKKVGRYKNLGQDAEQAVALTNNLR